ncbi:hypothetical protein VR45_26590 [Streptomyces sp. NRRL S-495]|nr:hypothetical protein VR45_26590 [Streptomyces sp. NRRL S-495]
MAVDGGRSDPDGLGAFGFAGIAATTLPHSGAVTAAASCAASSGGSSLVGFAWLPLNSTSLITVPSGIA